MSYRILDAETGEVIRGGLSYIEAEAWRANCPDPKLYVFEDEPEPDEEEGERET